MGDQADAEAEPSPKSRKAKRGRGYSGTNCCCLRFCSHNSPHQHSFEDHLKHPTPKLQLFIDFPAVHMSFGTRREACFDCRRLRQTDSKADPTSPIMASLQLQTSGRSGTSSSVCLVPSPCAQTYSRNSGLSSTTPGPNTMR